ncbi:MAG TPA: hypothetical protein VIP28_13200 [Nocardioides sp.]
MSDPFPQYAPRPKPAQLHPKYIYQAPKPPGPIRRNAHLLIAGGIALLIGAVVGYVLYVEATATRAADATAVAQPTAQPGPPVPQRKPVEKSPPVAEVVPGDGTWLIGREIKRGTYQTAGGTSCYWSRLANLSGELEAVTANGFRNGPQVVALGPDDVAFVSQGCPRWVMVK